MRRFAMGVTEALADWAIAGALVVVGAVSEMVLVVGLRLTEDDRAGREMRGGRMRTDDDREVKRR